jgi:cold shock protein
VEIGILLVVVLVVVAVGVIVWALRSGARAREAGQMEIAPGPREEAPPRGTARAGSFHALVKAEPLRAAVEQLGWSAPTRVQTALAGAIRGGGDVAAEAHRGDGVRAAYLLPLLDRVDRDGLLSLIISPDDRGVQEIAGEARTLAQRTELWIGAVRTDAPLDRERRNVRAGFDLLVGTLDRITLHLESEELDLGEVETVVLTGAHRLAAEAHREELEKVLDALPAERQVVVVTDQRSDAVEALARRVGARSLQWIEVGDDRREAPAGSKPERAPERTQAEPAPSGEVQAGTVRWFNNSKGYGFITPETSEEDVFVHYSSIEGEGFRALDAGDRVQFRVVEAAKGPEAREVRRFPDPDE